MASNFWQSSHCNHWLVDRITVDKARAVDVKYASKRQLACLSIYFANLLQRLGKRLGLRQRPIATSIVYFRRFFLKNAYCECDPYLVLATCCYVAAKLEETPVHIKSVVLEARSMFNDLKIQIKHFPMDNTKLAEMEFYLLEDLDFHLTVFHPYRSLAVLCGKTRADTGSFAPDDSLLDGERAEDVKTGRGTGSGAMEVDKEIFEQAWFIVNDTYRTDLCLLYPPYMIAVSAFFLAVSHFQVAHPKRAVAPVASAAAQTSAVAQPSKPAAPSPIPANILGPLQQGAVLRPRHPLPANPLHPSLPMNPLLLQAQQAQAAANTQSPLGSYPPSARSSPMPGAAPGGSARSTPAPQSSPAAAAPPAPVVPSPQDPIAYLASLNVNFDLVTRISQEILSLWPLWETFKPKSASASTLSLSVGGGDGVSDDADVVALVEKMRADRDRDLAHPEGGWPVQERGGGSNVASASQQGKTSGSLKRAR